MKSKSSVSFCLFLQKNRFIVRNWLTVVGAGKSEICRVGEQAVSAHKSWYCSLEFEIHREGQASWKHRQSFYDAFLRHNSFFFRKSQPLLLRPSANWMSPSHIMKNNLLYLKSCDCKCVSHLKYTFIATSRLLLDQITGHIAWPSWYITLTITKGV